jgi:membrane protein DedA with SNARE-associated domain
MPVSAIIEHFPYIGLFILLILGGIGFPFPEGVALIGSGFLISTSVVQPIPALFIAYSGVLIGDFLSYYFGKKYGRMIVANKMFRRIISPERLSMLEDRFNKWGILFVLIGGRLIGEIFLVAGIMRMPLLKFLTVDAISSLFTIAIWVGIGYAGGHSLQVIRKDISRIEHIAIILVIVLLVIYLLFRYFKSRRNNYFR